MSVARWAPFYRLWRAERRRHAVTLVDLKAHRMHLAIATAQRDRAREIVATMAAEREGFSAEDEAFLESGRWPA